MHCPNSEEVRHHPLEPRWQTIQERIRNPEEGGFSNRERLEVVIKD
jgi:hypothetical protein